MLGRVEMAGLIFVRRIASVEKAATDKTETNLRAVVIVGILIIAFLGVAVFLYVEHQPEAGRLIIDLALAFFGWATGRAVGEKVGVASGGNA